MYALCSYLYKPINVFLNKNKKKLYTRNYVKPNFSHSKPKPKPERFDRINVPGYRQMSNF